MLSPRGPREDARLTDPDRFHREPAADRADALLDVLQAAEQPIAINQLDQLVRGHRRIKGDFGDAAVVEFLHLAQQGHAVFGIARVRNIPEQDRRVVAGRADPVVGHC